MSAGDNVDASLDDACAQLYSADPTDFVTLRAELSRQARQAGDAATAKAITALRKPTTSAAIVNRHVAADPSAIERLTAIGDRLRAAQGDPAGVDRNALRELSDERRRIVRDVVADALAGHEPSPGAGVCDEVRETFDAAVADPGVAGRLGRLTHAERWSGFGVAPAGDGPALRVVAGGRKAPTRTSAPSRPNPAAAPARPTRQTQRELDSAQRALSTAQDVLDKADEQVASARRRVEELTEQLDGLQQQLTAAEKAVKDAVGAQRSSRSHVREARAARDRAARRAER